MNPSAPSTPPPRKRHHYIRNTLAVLGGGLVLLIALIVVLAAVSGSPKTTSKGNAAPATTSSPASAAPAAAPATTAPSATFDLSPGQSVTESDSLGGSDGGTITVVKIVRTTQPNDPSFQSGPANGLYILAEITYTAANGKTLDPNALDWYALSSTGQHYNYDSGNAQDALSSAQMLNAGPINGNESTTGWISFDVPAGHGTIDYAPNYQGGPTASWKY